MEAVYLVGMAPSNVKLGDSREICACPVPPNLRLRNAITTSHLHVTPALNYQYFLFLLKKTLFWKMSNLQKSCKQTGHLPSTRFT